MELKVWVEGIQRIVCGVTDATTCQDVVYALAHATGKTGRFTLVEKWRSNERLLPPHEHPLKVLSKWGEYANDVQLVLRRSTIDAKPPQQETNRGTSESSQGFSHPPLVSLNGDGGCGKQSKAVSPSSGIGGGCGKETSIKKSLTFSSSGVGGGSQNAEPPFRDLSKERRDWSEVPRGVVKGIPQQQLHHSPKEQRQLEISQNDSKVDPSRSVAVVQDGCRDDTGLSENNSGSLSSHPPARSERELVAGNVFSGQHLLDSSYEAYGQKQPHDAASFAGGQQHASAMDQNLVFGQGFRVVSPIETVNGVSEARQCHRYDVNGCRTEPPSQSISKAIPNVRNASQESHPVPLNVGMAVSGVPRHVPGTKHSPQCVEMRSQPKTVTTPPSSLSNNHTVTHHNQYNSSGLVTNSNSGHHYQSYSGSSPKSKCDSPRSVGGVNPVPVHLGTPKSRRNLLSEFKRHDLEEELQEDSLMGRGHQERVVYDARYRDLVRLINLQREKLSSQQADLTQCDAEIVYWEEKQKDQKRQIEVIEWEIKKTEFSGRDVDEEVVQLDKLHLEEEFEIGKQQEKMLQSELTLLRSKLSNCETELLQCKNKMRIMMDNISEDEHWLTKEEEERKQRETAMLGEIEELQKDINDTIRDYDSKVDSTSKFDQDVKRLEVAILDKKKQVEGLVREMKEANLESLTFTPSEEIRHLLEGNAHKGPGSSRKIVGSPRQLENAVPTSKNPHGVWV